MAGRAEVVGWDVERTGTGLTILGSSFGWITIETRKTLITVGATCVVFAAQTFSSDVITGFRMTKALTWFADATENSAINPSVPWPTRFTRGATVPWWALTHFHSCCNTCIGRVGDCRFQVNGAQPEDGIHPKAVCDLYQDSLHICQHCHKFSSVDWNTCVISVK